MCRADLLRVVEPVRERVQPRLHTELATGTPGDSRAQRAEDFWSGRQDSQGGSPEGGRELTSREAGGLAGSFGTVPPALNINQPPHPKEGIS